MPKASDNEFPKIILEEGTTPTTPAAGTQKLFIDSADHVLKLVDESDVVTEIGGTDATAIHTDVDSELSGLTEEVTPASGDWFLLEKSTGAKRKVDVDNLPGGGDANHGYYEYKAASLEPLAIEVVQLDTFSYAIASNVTKFLLASWNVRLGSAGRFDIRKVGNPLVLRDITITGLATNSYAILLDPTLPTFTNARDTYFDRLTSIAELPTKYVSLTSTSQTSTFLPGPYGSIITGISCFDFAWVALNGPRGSSTGINLLNEVSDSTTIRSSGIMNFPVSKYVCSGFNSSASGVSGNLAGLTYIICPSTWGKVTDATSYTFRDDFMGVALDTGVWTITETTADNVEIDTNFQWCKARGNGSGWSNGAYKTNGIARTEGRVLLADVFMPSSGNIGIGWMDGGGIGQANLAHGIVFNAGTGYRYVIEASNTRSSVSSATTSNRIYRVRITLHSGGSATYEIQGGSEYAALGGNSWTDITPGTSSSPTNTLYPGFNSYTAQDSYIGDVRVY